MFDTSSCTGRIDSICLILGAPSMSPSTGPACRTPITCTVVRPGVDLPMNLSTSLLFSHYCKHLPMNLSGGSSDFITLELADGGRHVPYLGAPIP